MSAPNQATPSDSLLGRVAVAAKLITMEQLSQATREQARAPGTRNLGQVLVALGFLTEANLQKALEIQKSVLERAVQKAGSTGAPAAPAKPAPAASPGRELGVETDAN